MEQRVKSITILLITWFLPCTLVSAQTPFDAFSPETSRIILDGDSIAAWRAEQQSQLSHHRPTHSHPDTILCTLIADLRNEQLLLVDIASHRPVAYAPFTDEIKNWLSVDPLVDKNITTSPYLYCNGNPIMFIDPDGRAAYYNDNGDFLGVDADGFTGRVYITDQETYSDLCDYNNVVGLPELQNSQLSAEAYSKIYTDILKQSDYGYSFDNVMGNAIAIYSVNGCYNDPQAPRSSGVMSDTKRWVDNNHNVRKMKLMVNQDHGDVTKYLNTVENIISFLGVHEYVGHGVFDFGDKDGTHDLAYLLQMQHPTWNSLTPDARLFIKKSIGFI